MKEVKDVNDYSENYMELVEILEEFKQGITFLANENRQLKKERDMYKSMHESIKRLVYTDEDGVMHKKYIKE